MSYDAIILDLETNGLNPDFSVLQFTAFLLKAGRVQKIINRYYYPREGLTSAFLIHGLDSHKISELREKQKASYAKYFEDDEEILGLLKDLSSDAFLISYNVRFENGFLKARGIEFKKTIDVMLLYQNILKIPHPYYGYKYPKLSEAVSVLYRRYGVVLHDKFHNSLVDAYYTYRLFRCLPFLKRPYGNFRLYFFLSGMYKYYPTYLQVL
jgi:DNA polymerase III epsilon subunit-like protein